MSQSVARNIKSAHATVFNKTSGDGNNGKTQIQKEKSRSNIPKNLRYDLEKALVGLCDVWFEEIKPYLVRNNIKVNVARDCGDHEPAQECSHLDPASSASHCGLCQLLFNAANSIESAVCQASSVLSASAAVSSATLTEAEPRT